jgi:glycosyltransferase family protein
MRVFFAKKTLVRVWNLLVDTIIKLQNLWLLIADIIISKIISPPKVQSIDKTIDKILKERCSVSRFGDGELKLINGRNISFQKHNQSLQSKLKEVLRSNQEGHIVCLPDVFDTNNQYTPMFNKDWRRHLAKYRLKWYTNLDMKKEYFNSFISRCYLPFQDQSRSKKYFEKIKKIWEKREVIIVEGEFSRLGIENDLFDNAKSIKRVLCPSKNAFEKYEEILSYIHKFDKKNLILLALGPTASVLAFDLHKEGYQAMDIGHIDVEYEWLLMGATKKEPIKNKFVNEVNGGEFEIYELNQKYYDEIIINLNTIESAIKVSDNQKIL